MIFRFRARFEAFERFARNAAEALDASRAGPVQDGLLAASDVYMQAMRDRFAREGDGDWAPLADSTVREREEKGYGDHPTLHRTGSLESSLQRGDGYHVIDVTAAGVSEGTAHPNARFHQDGTDRMPARPILVQPSPDTVDAVRTELAVGVSVALKNAAAG